MRHALKLTFLFMILLCVCSTALAGGLLPTANEIYGEFMPSASFSLGREADETEMSDIGQTLIWDNVYENDYELLDQYLSAKGCTVSKWSHEGDVIVVDISKDGYQITLSYNHKTNTLRLHYPKGTRPEVTQETVKVGKNSILPSLRKVFGITMPNMSLFSDWMLQEERTDNGKTIHSFTGVAERQWLELGCEAAEFDCKLVEQEVNGDTVSFIFGKEEATLTFVYNISEETAILFYSANAIPAETIKGTGEISLLPTMDEIFGTTIPSIGTVLKRWPDLTENDADGNLVQIYKGFTDSEYDDFSIYLKESGCQVGDYSVNDGTLVIDLNKNESNFTFVYDRNNQLAKLIFGTGTRTEKVITATPAPTSTPRPTTYNAEETQPKYSESECRNAAIEHLKNHLKNPKSLQIHSCTTISSDNSSYWFQIDYSAQNGFGGYSREKYYAKVSKTTGKVISAGVI